MNGLLVLFPFDFMGTTKTIVFDGIAEKIENAGKDAMAKIIKKLDYDAVLAQLIDKLDAKYTLVYVDYRDAFNDDTIAKFINSNDPSILDESIDEWSMDNKYDSCMAIIKETYNDDEKAVIEALELSDELRYAIEERDNGNPLKDMLRNARAHFCYVDILPAETEGCIESYQYTDNPELEYKKIAKASGLSMKEDRKDIEELYHNGASFSISPLVWFFSLSPLDYYDALMAQYKIGKDSIEVTLHGPGLAIRDHCNGAGHSIDTTRKVVVKLSDIKSDEAGNGYSFGVETCGMVRGSYECGFTF